MTEDMSQQVYDYARQLSLAFTALSRRCLVRKTRELLAGSLVQMPAYGVRF